MLAIFWTCTHIYKAGIDVVAAVHAPDGLQAHARRLVRQDVHQAVLELVDCQVGTDEPVGAGLDIGQALGSEGDGWV